MSESETKTQGDFVKKERKERRKEERNERNKASRQNLVLEAL